MQSFLPKCCVAVSALLSLSNIVHADPLSFAGPYAGAFGGYGSGTSAQHDGGFVYIPPAAPLGGEGGVPVRDNADGHYRLHGGLGGAVFGYSYVFNRFIIGAEADIATTDIKGSSAFCGSPAHTCGTSIGATGDVRARFGVPYGQFMPFIAGGLAVASVGATDSLFGASGRTGRAGYTIGGGVEYKINATLSVRAEYLHADFGSQTQFDIVPNVPERISVTTDIVRAGITYNFSPIAVPVVAKY